MISGPAIWLSPNAPALARTESRRIRLVDASGDLAHYKSTVLYILDSIGLQQKVNL